MSFLEFSFWREQYPQAQRKGGDARRLDTLRAIALKGAAVSGSDCGDRRGGSTSGGNHVNDGCCTLLVDAMALRDGRYGTAVHAVLQGALWATAIVGTRAQGLAFLDEARVGGIDCVLRCDVLDELAAAEPSHPGSRSGGDGDGGGRCGGGGPCGADGAALRLLSDCVTARDGRFLPAIARHLSGWYVAETRRDAIAAFAGGSRGGGGCGSGSEASSGGRRRPNIVTLTGELFRGNGEVAVQRTGGLSTAFRLVVAGDTGDGTGGAINETAAAAAATGAGMAPPSRWERERHRQAVVAADASVTRLRTQVDEATGAVLEVALQHEDSVAAARFAAKQADSLRAEIGDVERVAAAAAAASGSEASERAVEEALAAAADRAKELQHLLDAAAAERNAARDGNGGGDSAASAAAATAAAAVAAAAEARRRTQVEIRAAEGRHWDQNLRVRAHGKRLRERRARAARCEAEAIALTADAGKSSAACARAG
ncbi:unnamed protein product, partial [Phaeothamnion confervicola]